MKQHRRHKTLLMCAAVALVFAVPPSGANADPTPGPSPGYVIQTPGGPVVGGMRSLPPICGPQPRACAGNWDPNSGTWVFPPGT
jgi:hypothetical protein